MRWNDCGRLFVLDILKCRTEQFWRKLTACCAFLCLAAIPLLNGCDAEERRRHLTDVSGHLPDLQFSLLSDEGNSVNQQHYRGYRLMLFFGYAGCASECPTTLFRLAKVLQSLGEDAERTRILFVSLAPERDTPEVLHRYLKPYNAEQLIGLTGDPQEIQALEKRYRIAYRPPSSGDTTHSTVVYVFDAEGRARLLVTPDDKLEIVAEDLRRLALAEP